MKIGLIGCGKVGTTIFYWLRKYHDIVGVYDTNAEHERRTRRILRAPKCTRRELVRQSKALFFATTDDQIYRAYTTIKTNINKPTYIYHFSGLLSSKIFPLSKYTLRASVHPFATFPQIEIPPRRTHYPLYIEGDKIAIKAACRIFPDKHFTIKKIARQKKFDYHLIGVLSSNLTVGLLTAINDLSTRLNWSQSEINDTILPIIKETLANVQMLGIKHSLSGPLERGDIKTVKQHLKSLKSKPNLLSIYRSLSLHILTHIPSGKNRKKLIQLLRAYGR